MPVAATGCARAAAGRSPRRGTAFFRAAGAAILLAAWGGHLGGVPEAAAQVTGEIRGPGATSYPIAIPALRAPDGGAAEGGLRFADVVGRDLTLSGYFRVIDRAAYIDAGHPSTDIQFQNWAAIGAMALVAGTLERSGNEITVEARAFDVVAQRPLTAKLYRGPANDLARVAHRFADEILRVFTGTAGPFESAISFVSTREGGVKEVYMMTFDAETPVRLSTERSIVVAPAWSPDARRILFSSYRGGRPSLREIDVASRRSWQVVAARALSAGGAWSPDGSLVAASLEIQGNPEIVLLKPDGTFVRQLTDSPAIDVSPSWSPDGREIAFCTDRAGGPQIFAAEVSSGRVRRVTYSGLYNTAPAWSPAGDEIAYTQRVDGRFQIAIVAARGGQGRLITSDRGDSEDPSWAPDSRYLVFASTQSGRGRLMMMDKRGLVRKQLTHGEGDDSSPAWSPRLQ
jgi:TolB protein